MDACKLDYLFLKLSRGNHVFVDRILTIFCQNGIFLGNVVFVFETYLIKLPTMEI
jgi:sRNA-binding regulator protein Hfq